MVPAFKAEDAWQRQERLIHALSNTHTTCSSIGMPLALQCVIETLRQQLAAFAPSPRPTTAAVTGPSAGRAPANHFAQQPVAAAADPRVKPPAPKRPRGEAADTFWGQQGVHRPAVVHGTSQPQATSVPQHGSTSISGIHRADMASLGCHTGARGKSSTISSEHVEDDDALDSLADLVDLVDEEEEGSQAGDDQAAYPLGTGPAGAAGADDGRGEAWQADADAWGMQADAGGDENAAVSMHAAQQDEWMDASCTMQEGVQQPHGVADEDVMWHGEDEMHAHGRGHAAPPLPHGLVGAPRPSFVAHRSGKPMVGVAAPRLHTSNS